MEVEGLDSMEGLLNAEQNSDIFLGDQDEETSITATVFQNEKDRIDNPNRKLSTIEAILDDQMDIEESKQKLQAIKTTLAEHPLEGQERVTVNSYSDPEKKLEQIVEVVENKEDAHIHAQFASIQAILGTHAADSNPWVQAHQALSLIEDSSRQLIKSEEKRQKELRESWKKEMDEKAQHHHDTAGSQEWWKYGSGTVTAAAFVLPFAGNSIAKILKSSKYLEPVLRGYDVKQIDGFCKMGAETLRQSGSQFMQESSQISQLYSKNEETLHDWSTQQERQDLEQQGQIVQETRQNDNSLKERHLEVIKTLTAQIVGR